MGPGATCKLAAGRRIAPYRIRNIFEAESEDIVQNKRGALQRRESFNRNKPRKRDSARLLLGRRFYNGSGSPGPAYVSRG